MSKNESKFDWGQSVRVKQNVPEHSGVVGEVISVYKAEKSITTRYTVEFGDGSDVEIEEEFLESA